MFKKAETVKKIKNKVVLFYFLLVYKLFIRKIGNVKESKTGQNFYNPAQSLSLC